MGEPAHPDDVINKPIVRPEHDCDEESPLLPEQKTRPAYNEKFGVRYTPVSSAIAVISGESSALLLCYCEREFRHHTSAALPGHVPLGSLPVEFLFAATQGPDVFLSLPVGWLKQRVGIPHPTSAGFTALAVLLWLTGVRFPWANRHNRGPVLYMLPSWGAV